MSVEERRGRLSDTGHIDESIVPAGPLTEWMDGQGLGTGPVGGFEKLAGGTQNIMLRFERDGRGYVLRRGPVHKRANSDKTMVQEARILDAIRDTDVPHPALIAACGDLEVIGAAFYLMEPVDGFNPGVGLPEPHASDAEMRRGIGFSMAETIAKLGAVDHLAVGLGDIGHPDGWLERQVERWRSHLAGYDEMDGYPGSTIPGVEDVAAWLEEGRPSEWTPGILHGDFHLANVMVRNDGPELAAAVDWELSTIGDPLLDLGHLLATWADPEIPGADGLTSIPDLPTPAEIVEHYAARSTRPVTQELATWYRVLACYRLGIILEGTHARACAGKAPKGIGDLLHAITLSLFAQATNLINR